jgi:hypothetical protein
MLGNRAMEQQHHPSLVGIGGLLKGGRLVCGRGIQFWEMNAITRIQSSPYAVRGILGEQSY